MAAIRQTEWDQFVTLLRHIGDAIGEHLYDRPNTLDKTLFDDMQSHAQGFFTGQIAAKIDKQQAQDVTDRFMHMALAGKKGQYAEVLKPLRDIFSIIPELKGRYEAYEDSVQRRKTAYSHLIHGRPMKHIFDLHAKGKAAFFFDLDGSLMMAEPGRNLGYDEDARLQYVLNRLNVQTQSATAVVTGRPEIFMQQVFPNGAFFSATEHGVFVRERVGGDVVRAYSGGQNIAALKKNIADELAKRGLSSDECYVEQEKEGSVTVQFTKAANPEHAALHIGELLQQVMFSPVNARCVDPMMLVDGNVPDNRVMDLVPSSADKGHTLEWFYKTYPQIFADKTPVMVGDSGGDKTAMEWAKAQGGYAIGVGAGAPECADTRLYSVFTMRALLTTMVENHMNQQYKSAQRPFQLAI